jgi:hypothetical protein
MKQVPLPSYVSPVSQVTELSTPAARRHIFTRRIHCEGFARDDGLYDIEARVTDTVPEAERIKTARPNPRHDMQLRLTIDRDFHVHAVEVHTYGAPNRECYIVEPPHQKLVGKNIMRGWRRAVNDAVGGEIGCTHIRELLMTAATVVYQTLAGRVKRERKPDELPGVAGTCKAWALDGEQVRTEFPLHYKPKQKQEA